MGSRWGDTCDSCGEWMMDCLCPHNNRPIESADEEIEEAIKIRASWDKEQEIKNGRNKRV